MIFVTYLRFFSVGMENLLRSYGYPVLLLIGSIITVVVVSVNYRYQYWKRRNVPYLKPHFPFGNQTSLLPKGIDYGLISDVLYQKFKKMKCKVGGMRYYITFLVMLVPRLTCKISFTFSKLII